MPEWSSIRPWQPPTFYKLHTGDRRRRGLGEIEIAAVIAGDAVRAVQGGTTSAQSFAIRGETGEARHSIRDEQSTIILLEYVRWPAETIPTGEPFSVSAENLNAVVLAIADNDAIISIDQKRMGGQESTRLFAKLAKARKMPALCAEAMNLRVAVAIGNVDFAVG